MYRALPVLVALFGVACQADEQLGHNGLPLACELGEPVDTLAGFARCMLEEWQPCRVVREGFEPFEVDLRYEDGHLVEETRTIHGAAQRHYAYEGDQLALVEQTQFQPSITSYAYDGDELRTETRTIFEPSETSYFYDDGRLVRTERTLFNPQTITYSYEGDRVATVVATSFSPWQQSYSYGANGWLARLEQTVVEPFVTTFEYDEQDRLIRSERTGFSPQVREYTWDGDRLGMVVATGFAASTTHLEYDCSP